MSGCGFSCWHPHWLQKFANTKWFMIIYGLLGTIQGTSFLYIVVTLTTLEKRFKIPSQTTGIILSGNEVSQIMLSLVLTYFGGQRNRPRWIAWGVVFSAISCFILAWPHFIYGAGEEALQYTEEYMSKYQEQSTNLSSLLQMSPIDRKNNKLCTTAARIPDECEEDVSYGPLILIFMSQFVLGIGNTLYYSLGQSYLDDNTKQSNTPLMLGYAFSMRMCGPIIGFGLAYFTLNIFIDPRYTPTIKSDDPRWLGAYWLGWNILGGLMLIFAGLIGLFPKHLPRKKHAVENGADSEKCDLNAEHNEKEDFDEKKVLLKNFPTALKRLLKNKLLIFNYIAGIFHILGSSGYITFMARTMEVQFEKASQEGSILTGPMTILGMTIGFLLSGYLIKRFKPAPKYLFFWNVILALISMSTQIYYTQIGCNGENQLTINGSAISCNANCDCDGIPYSPVCDRSTNTTYFSPCHAGCSSFDKKAKVYNDCTCTTTMTPQIELYQSEIPNGQQILKKRSISAINVYDTEFEYIQEPDWLDRDDDNVVDSNKRNRRQLEVPRIITPHACFGGCSRDYYTFTIVSMISSFLGSSGAITSILLSFRAVDKADKAFSQGLSLFLVSLFALIPGPIIYGRIIDSSCLIWNFKCGRRGDCQLYDPIKFRYYLHSTSAIFIFSGACFSLLVWYYARNLDLYGDDEPKKVQNDKEKSDSPESQPLNKP